MKITGRIVCSLLVGVAVVGTTVAMAQDVTTSLDVQFCSRYVWRGMPANVESAIQPSLTVSHPSGLTYNLWGSYDVTDSNGHNGKITEIDHTLAYASILGKELRKAYSKPDNLIVCVTVSSPL